MKIHHSIFSILVFLIFSCGEKEKPTDEVGLVRITGIELKDGSVPAGRLAKTFAWNHILNDQLQLTFTGLESGESSSISINPNDFTSPYSIELPFGNYEIEGASISENISSTLPITVSGQINVNGASTNLLLTAESDYGLFTFSKSNLLAAPKVLDPAIAVFSNTPDFYYAYIKGNLLMKAELVLSNGKSFRLAKDSKPFFHQHFQILSQSTEERDNFQPKDFEVSSEVVILGENGYPRSLSPYSISELGAALNETSGLQWIQGRLFSINDGGNSAEIQEINPENGSLIRTISVTNASNIDWEDLAASSTHLFIGDFGNNLGNRTDLKILKIPIAAVLNQNEAIAEVIDFQYSDQSDFSGAISNHNFDCEAMIFRENQLHLFSKNLGDGRSKHYTLSPNQGNQVANLQNSFDAKGLITGADVSADGKNLVLLGYENQGITSRSFVWTFASITGSVLSSPSNQFFLGSPAALGQTEGITINSQYEIKISGERISFSGLTVPPKLVEVDLGGIFNP